jgi:nitrate/nitrite-specific signal transduction histidine kinase
MTLAALTAQAPAGLRQLHSELRETLSTVQSRTQQLNVALKINVAKHAQVESAQVIVDVGSDQLLVEVIDQGVGFEWQYDLFLDQSRGFGLFSISDRVYSARGQFSVDTAPGKGCRVGLSFPLAPA